MTEFSLSRRLSQTKISAFFSGCVKSVPVEKTSPRKGGKTNLKKKNRMPRAPAIHALGESCSEFARSRLLPSCLAGNLSFATIPKRKLPAPIFSDDEDDFENDTARNQQTGSSTSPKQPKNTVSLNKPSPAKRKKVCENVENCRPPITSTPLSVVFQDKECASPNSTDSAIISVPSCSKSRSFNIDSPEVNRTPTKSKSITVLENIVVSSPTKTSPTKKSPVQQEKFAKKEGKKANYDQLKVFREFFINVSKNNCLNNLLSDQEKNLLQKLFNMERNYQYICIKLFLWKPIWYNIFQYVEKNGLQMEDDEVISMYNYLKENGFVDTEYMVEDTFTLLNFLNLKDIRDLMRGFRLTNLKGAKEFLITKLLQYCKTQITLNFMETSEEILRDRIKEKMGFCVKMTHNLQKYLYHVYLLNTFTNSNLTEPQDYFKNVSYFNVVFPSYKIENFHIFYTLQEFSKYADAVRLGCDLGKAVENKQLSDVFKICESAFRMLKQLNEELGEFDDSRELHLERYTPNAQYIHILTSGAKHITTAWHNDVKIWFEYLLSQKYCRHKRATWYCQLALIYTVYMKDYEKAARLIITALQEDKENFSEVHLHELAYRGKVLNKKTYNLLPLLHDEIASLVPQSCDRTWPQDIVDCKSLKSEEPGRRRTYVHRCENGDTNYLNVEQTALQYYRNLGFPNGEHCEGNLIIASFCLLFWDIMYEKYVRGTFTSSVQNVPLDMYTKYFYINRESFIKKRLRSIHDRWTEEEFKNKLIDRWTLHSHENSLCQIDSVVEGHEHLYHVLTCIGRPILAKIFERLAKNFKAYRSGFPDLILWNLEEKRAKFVEVKSENDKLSINQKLWLNYLMDIGASVAVCHIESKSSKRKL